MNTQQGCQQNLLSRRTSGASPPCHPKVGPSRKIFGGYEAKPHSRPDMAFLRVQRAKNTTRCGGFLVHEDFMLTAAHCWGSSINVTLGAHNIGKKERTQKVIEMERAIPHPNYDANTKVNDIMLFMTPLLVPGYEKVNPVAVPGAYGLLGDSEGPLMCGNMAQGIVFYGKRDGTTPSVETKILSFLRWIEITMRHF
ncbi:mast cell protease 1A-like [Rhynchonycteris naso]